MIKTDVNFRQHQASAFGAIILYGSHNAVQFGMYHDIQDNALLAGRPLDQVAVAKSLQSLMAAQQGFSTADFLPDNILVNTAGKLAWWSKPQRRSVFFRLDDGEFSFECAHPGLVFTVTADRLYVAAVKGSERPSADSEVFYAPYMNVWESGQMCAGNVRLPGSTIAEHIKAWESAFFDSFFTHPNGIGMVSFKGDMVGLWQYLRQNPDTFPEEALVTRGMTAAEFCKKGAA